MIDTHAHLNFPPLFSKAEEVVKKSEKAGLRGIVIASSNLADSKKAVDLAKKWPGFLFAAVGIHPQKTDPENEDSIAQQIKVLDDLIVKNRDSIFAVGETGLDFTPAPEGEEDRTIEEQRQLFLEQLALSQKYHLPVIIHARQTNDEIIEIINHLAGKMLTGVFHCYTGGKKRIERICRLPGLWYFGFDGNLTYDQGLQTIIQLIPKERILLETDAPFLAPVPYRGQENFPYYLPLIQQKINEIFGQDLTGQILANSAKLLKLEID
jgi:TatD DNase family protein